MKKISIIGAGAFGYAMAWLVGNKHVEKEVYVYDVNKEWIGYIKENRSHPIFHKGAGLHEKVVVCDDLKETVTDSDFLILAVPSKFLRGAMRDMKPLLKDGAVLLNLSKGLEVDSEMRASEIINEVLGEGNCHVGTLSGGMIAREVTEGAPLCTDVAFDDIEVSKKVCEFLSTDKLRLDPSDDLIGVEYAGAIKNIIAIGAGVFDGAGYKESSKSAYVSYMAKEAKKLALALGAKDETFSPGSQAWLGDLMTTCFGGSRNLEFGSLLGKGYKSNDAMEIMTKERKSVEGFLTIKVAVEMAKERDIDMPLLNELNKVVHLGGNGKDFIDYIINHW